MTTTAATARIVDIIPNKAVKMSLSETGRVGCVMGKAEVSTYAFSTNFLVTGVVVDVYKF